jgi:2'-5' RNA ligase
MKKNVNRFVIVCLINGEALEFHDELTSQVCSLFKVKRQKLPAHFTIKAPFENENISEIETITEEFCSKNKAFPINLKDYGHFRDAVVFMDVKPSKEAERTHDYYIDELHKISWLDWKPNEGKGKTLHCTIVSKIRNDKFEAIWNYCNKHSYNFSINFDNISIMKWEQDRWVLYKSFKFQN